MESVAIVDERFEEVTGLKLRRLVRDRKLDMQKERGYLINFTDVQETYGQILSEKYIIFPVGFAFQRDPLSRRIIVSSLRHAQ